jgi:hypothetical protein
MYVVSNELPGLGDILAAFEQSARVLYVTSPWVASAAKPLKVYLDPDPPLLYYIYLIVYHISGVD